MAKSRVVKQRFFIKAPPSKVFKALVKPRMLRKWFLKSAKLSPRKGGNYSFTWEGGYVGTGKVLDYERDKKLSLYWLAGSVEDPLGHTRVTFKLKSKNDGTILDLTHSGFKSGEKWMSEYTGTISGWAYFLANLKSVLQHNKDLRSPHDVF